jgi:hypothetical protein
MTIGDQLRDILAARDGEDVLDAARRVVRERAALRWQLVRAQNLLERSGLHHEVSLPWTDDRWAGW